MGSDGEPLSPEMLPATVYRDIMAWAARMEASWKSFVEAKNDVDETAEKRWLAQDNLIETVHKHALAVQEQMEVVRDQVMAVREEVGATRAALKQFEASQENFRALVFQKFDRLQGTIDLIKEDINVNFASSNTALTNARTVRGDQDNLTELISAMERRFRVMSAQVEELRKDQAERNAPKP